MIERKKKFLARMADAKLLTPQKNSFTSSFILSPSSTRSQEPKLSPIKEFSQTKENSMVEHKVNVDSPNKGEQSSSSNGLVDAWITFPE